MKIVYERVDSMSCVKTAQRVRYLDVPVLVNIAKLNPGDELRRFVPKQARPRAQPDEPWVEKAMRDQKKRREEAPHALGTHVAVCLRARGAIVQARWIWLDLPDEKQNKTFNSSV